MLSWNYDRKWHKKWTNECTNCKVPVREGQNSFIPRYLHPCPKHFFIWNFRWPLTWPRYRSKVRKRLNPTSSLGFKENLIILSREVSMSRPKTGSIRLAMWPIVARSRDLKLFCQVTLNWETRIPPVSMYIQAGFGPPGLESRFQSLFHDFTFLPVTYVTIRSRVFKRLYLLNGDT